MSHLQFVCEMQKCVCYANQFNRRVRMSESEYTINAVAGLPLMCAGDANWKAFVTFVNIIIGDDSSAANRIVHKAPILS